MRGALVQPSSISVSSLTLPTLPLQHPQRLESKPRKPSSFRGVGVTLNRVPELLEVQQPQLSGLCCVRVGDTSGSSKGRSARTGNYLSLSHQRDAWWEFLPLFSVSGFSLLTEIYICILFIHIYIHFTLLKQTF